MEQKTAPENMPDHGCRWARIFVRFAPIFAGLLVGAALVACLVRLALLRQALAGIVYEPSPEVTEQMRHLTVTCQKTADILVARFGPDVLPRQKPMDFPVTLTNQRDIERAEGSLMSHENYVHALQQGMIARYAQASEWLVDSMGRKAKRQRKQMEQEHGRETQAMQLQMATLREKLQPEGENSIFLPLRENDYRDRIETLEDAMDFLEYLGTLTENPAVQRHIDAAVGSLGRMREILPEPIPENRRLEIIRQIASLRQKIADLLRRGQKLESEEMAERLKQISQSVTKAMHGSWQVTRDIDTLRRTLAKEAEKLATVAPRRRNILIRGWLQAAGFVVAGIVLGFSLLVLADIISIMLLHARINQEPKSVT